MRATSVTDVILGEAGWRGTREDRYQDMRAIASVIANRARALGVTPEQVVQRTSEFNAYGQPLPKGVNAFRDLAEQALADVVQNGPIHQATFYAAPTHTENLPKGLKEVMRTEKGHVYYTDPQERAINTAIGTKPANYAAITRAPLADVADIQADRRLADAWGYSDPNTTLGLTTPANTPTPGLLADPRAMRDLSAGLLGGVAPPTARPAGMGRAPAAPTPRNTNIGRPGIPTPMSRPTPALAAPSVMSADVQARETGIPTNFAGPAGSFRSAQAPAPTSRMSPEAAERMAQSLPSVQMSDRQIAAARDRMAAAQAPADLSASVMERMGGFPDTPAPTQRAALPPSVMERMGGFPAAPAQAATAPARGLLGMDAQAATMPGMPTSGLLGTPAPSQPFGRPDAIAYADPAPTRPAPAAPTPGFAGAMGSPRAAGLLDAPQPYSAPPASYQTPAFSTARPQIDALGQPPIPGLQRAPQAPVQRQPAYQAPQVPDLPAPRTVGPAPAIAGPVGRQRQATLGAPAAPAAPTSSNINTEPAHRDMAELAARAAISEVDNRPRGALFGGNFSGPTGIVGGAMLGGVMAGLPGMVAGGLLGSQTVRDRLGMGGLGFGAGQPSAGALAAMNAGWGGFGNMNTTQTLATSLAREETERQRNRGLLGGLFGGPSLFSGGGLFGGGGMFGGNSGGDGFGTGTLSSAARSALDAGWSGFGNMPGGGGGRGGGIGPGGSGPADPSR